MHNHLFKSLPSTKGLQSQFPIFAAVIIISVLPFDEAMANRAPIVIVSGSDVQAETLSEQAVTQTRSSDSEW